MTFARLRLADWVALIAALGLLFATAADWYSTTTGDEARRVQGLTDPVGALGGEVARNVQEEAREAAEGQEKNAWQVTGAIDRVILAGILASFVLAVLAAFRRAAGKGSDAALGAALVAALTALLILYRLFQEPGFDGSTTVKTGGPIALVALGVLALASAQSLRTEEHDRELREEPVGDAPWEEAAA
jgi:drug/metabolite transporter (DMT)-like permease